MAAKVVKFLIKRKTILLVTVFFVFLFFGSEVFAAACNETGWNVDDCTVTITYNEIGVGSGLKTCEYRVTTDLGGTTGWQSISCSGASGSVNLNINIQPGTVTINEEGGPSLGPYNISSGQDVLIIESRVEDNAGNTNSATEYRDICTGCLIGGTSCSVQSTCNGKCQICNRSQSRITKSLLV